VATKPKKSFEYSWKNIGAMAVGFGAFGFVLAGLQTGWKFGAYMGLAAALAAIAFGAYMRWQQSRQPNNSN
jgi:uncharacterized membrane protein YebE (DUF533 family)